MCIYQFNGKKVKSAAIIDVLMRRKRKQPSIREKYYQGHNFDSNIRLLLYQQMKNELVRHRNMKIALSLLPLISGFELFS